MPLSGKQQNEIRENWLAPPGSPEEKKFLQDMLTSGLLDEHEQKYVREWLKTGDSHGMRNHGIWEAGKPWAIGAVAYKRAMTRHEKLPGNTWFVAYFLSQSKKQREIEQKLGLTEDGIRYHMDRLRTLFRQEYGYDEDQYVGTEHIAKWFVGL